VSSNKLIALVGPTAAGKSRMSVEVALALRERGQEIEIVSCDSMAVYRWLDIVADKPNMDERSGIVHHMIDIVDPGEPFTAVMYREKARAVISEIGERGHVPLLVGGSGLYFRAVVDDLEFAPTSPGVRARLETEPIEDLIERLRDADPVTAERLDPRNTRRIVRAVEVLELTGRPPSELRQGWDRFGDRYDLTVAGLTWARDGLLKRAAERVHRELDAGLVEEVRTVGAGRLSATAGQALGVKEMLPVIDGSQSLEEATQTLIRNTKSFVRRQISWFGADPRVKWFDATELGWDGARDAIVELFAD
jgi:tRNA dimethylallyltransferase